VTHTISLIAEEPDVVILALDQRTGDGPDRSPEVALEEVGSTRVDPLRAMVVDDEPTVREAIHSLLETFGFDVVAEAEDGLAAVEAVAGARPDVILMDVRMPRMDGLEATREIKARYPHVQVVLLSAYDDSTFRKSAEEFGATCYLVKGSSAVLLEQVLTSAAQLHRRLVELRGES
jgi:DNA-binding NarL/FixJ family response regulator